MFDVQCPDPLAGFQGVASRQGRAYARGRKGREIMGETGPHQVFGGALPRLTPALHLRLVVNSCNSLPVDTDFSSLAGFIQQVNRMDFLEFRCITDSF